LAKIICTCGKELLDSEGMESEINLKYTIRIGEMEIDIPCECGEFYRFIIMRSKK
jgi:hypothetical protein